MPSRKTVLMSLLVLTLGFHLDARAATSWDNSLIGQLLVQDDGGSAPGAAYVVVIMPTNMTYTPSCHTSPSLNRFYIDLSRAAGKSQYAMLLAAKIAGAPVSILNEICFSNVGLLRNVDITN